MVTEKTPDRMYVRWLDGYMRGFGMSVRQSDSDVEYIRADMHQTEVDALHAECDRLTAMMEQPSSCGWKQDKDRNWWSSCGEGYRLDDGGPVENGFKFCPYCGGEIRMGGGE